jgi:hypothetical protein
MHVGVGALVLTILLSACGTSAVINGSPQPWAHPVRSIPRLDAAVMGESRTTFQATWQATTHGSTTTVVLARDGQRAYFRVGKISVLATDGHTWFCASSGTCVRERMNPLRVLAGVYDGAAFLSAMRAEEHPSGPVALRGHISYLGETIAGLHSSCVVITGFARAARWCVATPGGVVTQWVAGPYTLTLTSFTKTPDQSLFVRSGG